MINDDIADGDDDDNDDDDPTPTGQTIIMVKGILLENSFWPNIKISYISLSTWIAHIQIFEMLRVSWDDPKWPVLLLLQIIPNISSVKYELESPTLKLRLMYETSFSSNNQSFLWGLPFDPRFYLKSSEICGSFDVYLFNCLNWHQTSCSLMFGNTFITFSSLEKRFIWAKEVIFHITWDTTLP